MNDIVRRRLRVTVQHLAVAIACLSTRHSRPPLISGEWKGRYEYPNNARPSVEVTLHLVQQGDLLYGRWVSPTRSAPRPHRSCMRS
ncbi:MAG: hypothetical protein R3B90_15010 [Planctomycetaceae bacterium]